MFGYAKEHEPCIIFMDEIDAIGGRRFSEGTSADREIQRTLMELLNQLDGFDYLGKTKIIMATNRPDTLDPALLRAGRLDRKIEIPLPNEAGRLEVLKIHAASVQKEGEIDFESVVKMSDGLNGADLRNVVTEAGLFAIKDYRDAVNQDDFNKAVRKVAESKKLEGKLGKWIRCVSVVLQDPLLTKVILQNMRSSKWYEPRTGMIIDMSRSAAIDVRKYKCTITASVSLIMKKRSAKPLHLQQGLLTLEHASRTSSGSQVVAIMNFQAML
jgi:SpoVK/Ycf46/Vps4 family AAA+-type ATPase